MTSIQAYGEEKFRKTIEDIARNHNGLHGLICHLMVVIIILLTSS
jgi:hypothetical protein